METLKDIRTKLGLTQAEVGSRVRQPPQVISNYETNVLLPNLEDALILERSFDQRIQWNENIPVQKKRQVIQCLIELCEYFPLPMVMEFTARMYRRNQAPEEMILTYAKLVSPGSGGAMYPAGVEIRKPCDCDD